MILREAAPAKVNLFLHVTGRCADGYHLLESLVVFTEAGDVLEAAEAEGVSLTVLGRFSGPLQKDSENNLVLRAAAALQRVVGVTRGARLTLTKNLPLGSGIGGGSADAAAALRLLCRLWEIAPDAAMLGEISRSLGSDVPACLASAPCFMRGTGESLAPWPLPFALPLVLVHPGTPLLTAKVYKRAGISAFRAPVDAPPEESVEAFAAWLSRQHNDLQPAATALLPQIQACLEALAAQPGCLLSRMSGSGATSFGLFTDMGAAERAEQTLRAAFPDAWVQGTSASRVIPAKAGIHRRMSMRQ